MTPRDEILSVLNHQDVRPVPYTIGWEGDVGQRLEAYYGSKDWQKRLKTYIGNVGLVDGMRKDPVEGREGFAKDLFGSVWDLNGRPFHLVEPGLKEPSFDRFDWPSPERFFVDDEGVAASQKYCRENNGEVFINAGLGWGLFETSWGIRGFENVLMDVVAEPEFYEELLDRITENFLAYVDFTCQTLPEIDAVMFGDDWSDQRGVIIGPERWRKLFKPRWAKVYARVHEYGKYVITHCCGSFVDLMEDVIEIGLDVIESCQPEARGMNPYELKKRFGDRITFWGGLGSQSIVPFGTPDEIKTEARRLCREMGKGGGYIISTAKGLQPETSTENAAAVIEAFTNQETVS